MRSLHFLKYHGAGNDLLVIDARREPQAAGLRFERAAVDLCDRHMGVGADGVLVISDGGGHDAAAAVRIINSDGSEGSMCGNGLRCVARHIVEGDERLTGAGRGTLLLQTPRGVLEVAWNRDGPGGFSATIDMGRAELEAAKIPVVGRDVGAMGRVVDGDLAALWGEGAGAGWWKAAGVEPRITCVSMGNPHAVFWCADVGPLPVATLGPMIQRHAMFPESVNVHFVQLIDDAHARVRTFERGAGETLACGTGACAVLVAGVLSGRLAHKATMHMPGGDLLISLRERDGHVLLGGPADRVFEGSTPVRAPWLG